MSLTKWTINILAILLSLSVFFAIAGGATWLIIEQYSKVHLVNAAYQKNSENDRKIASQKIAQTCKLPNFIAFRKCVADHLETYYADQATNEDLQAQKDMALWAFWVVLVSVLTAFITLVGVWYVKNTLKATADAVTAANKTNEIMLNEQRPIFVFEEVRFQKMASGGDISPFRAAAILKNVGKTPARVFDATLMVKKKSFETGEESDVWSWDKQPSHPMPVAADREYESPYFMVTSEDFESGDISYFLSFYYVSIFDEAEVEKFTFEVIGRLSPIVTRPNGDRHTIYSGKPAGGPIIGMELPIGPGGIKYTTERKSG